jgi:hypothetical protein
MMFILHRRHTYGYPWPVTVTASLFLFHSLLAVTEALPLILLQLTCVHVTRIPLASLSIYLARTRGQCDAALLPGVYDFWRTLSGLDEADCYLLLFSAVIE